MTPSNKSSRPEGILICGMHRSCTTWIYNVISAWLAQPDAWDRVWIPPADNMAADAYINRIRPSIGKCHHFDRNLANNSDIIIYSFRDIRTAGVSYLRKFGNCDVGTVGGWIISGDDWRAHSTIAIRYEGVVQDAGAQAACLRDILASKFGENVLRDIVAERLIAEVDDRFRVQQDAPEHHFDPSSMILPGHRTYQPAPDALNQTESTFYSLIEKTYNGWLHANRYLDHNLGQDLDYRTASAALAVCGMSPAVVDVGAERGSFIDFASEHGAQVIHAFEPLPRHIQYLHQRYAGRDQINIHSEAVSNQTGFTDFHIATDRSGRELDHFHTLSSEVGDSVEVVRSQSTLRVPVTSIASAQISNTLPEKIDFLKIDTDGHDLQVLQGLGTCRPSVIMAEYWQDLPATSGHNPYTLADLAVWAREHGYEHHVVVRRRDTLESVNVDETWTSAGDWGNVFFFLPQAWEQFRAKFLDQFMRENFDQTHALIIQLTHICEEKEGVIRGLSGYQIGQKKELANLQLVANERLALIDVLNKELQKKNSGEADSSEFSMKLDSLTQQLAAERSESTKRVQVIERLDTDLREANLARESLAKQILQLEISADRLRAYLRKSGVTPESQGTIHSDEVIAQLRDTSAHSEMLEQQIANLNVAVAETEAQAAIQAERAIMFECVGQERMELIVRLDASLREANEDRAAQAEIIGSLRRRIDELDLCLVHLNGTVAETTAHAASQTERVLMLEGVTQDRADLIVRLDANLRNANDDTTGQAEIVGNLRARVSELECQLTHVNIAVAEDTAQAAVQAERATMFQGVAQERMDLITRLDAGLRESHTERAAQAETIGGLRRRIDELELYLGQLNMTVAETTAHAVSQSERANILVGVTQDRADLIVRLDAHLRDANVGTTGQAEMMGSLRARIAELEHHVAHVNAAVAETTAYAVSQGERAAMLESVAQERATLIERLDGIARESSYRAASAEAVRVHLEREVAEQRTLVAAAYAQVADLAGASAEAAARAEAAERERDARLLVIEELVRTRDALLAALKPGHHRTGWLSRFFSH